MNLFIKLIKPDIQEILHKKDLGSLKNIVSDWEPQDIADLLKEVNISECILLFRLLPTEIQYKVFSELDSNMQEYILKNINDKHAKSIITQLDPDDRTKLFEDLPANFTRKLLSMLPPPDRKEALQLLGYPKDSVGRLMTPDYIAVKSYWTVEEAIQHIKKSGKDAETINVIYVIDDDWHLLDEIPIRKLILAESNQTIATLMDHHFISINANSDQEKAVKLIQKYNLVALPVTDKENHLLGIVTVDDIMDVLDEEQTEDFTKFSGIEMDSIGYDFITNIKNAPLTKIFRSRIIWLLVLLIMDFITGGIIQNFEMMIAKYVVLVTFLPVLVDTAGNAGSQSAVLVIRAFAVGTIDIKDWLYLLAREFIVSLGLGVVMGLGISIMGIIRGKNLIIAEVVVIAMVVNVVIGSIIGVVLPFIFLKFKKDPAGASTPLITTLSDIIGTGVYLVIARLLLK